MRGDITKPPENAGRKGDAGGEVLDAAAADRLEQEAADSIAAGDNLVTADDRSERLFAYRKARDIWKRLVKTDPGNLDWQHDLAVSYERIGDELFANGDSDKAFDAYSKGVEICTRLVAAAPRDGEILRWDREPRIISWGSYLALVVNKIGEVLFARRDYAGALSNYEQSLAVTRAWLDIDPGNERWRRYLALSYGKIAGVRLAEGNRIGALEAYSHRLVMSKQLAADYPGNRDFQRDVLVALVTMGEVRGDGLGARWDFEEARVIVKSLLRSDPDNALWRNDLAVIDGKLAAVVKSKNPGYTHNIMEDATARLEAVAADFGLPVDVAKQVLMDAAAKAARENTARATAEPRPAQPHDAATVRALAGLEHLKKQFDDLPASVREKERARSARQLVSAFERLERRGVDMDAATVREARRFLTTYNRRIRAAKLAAQSAAVTL